jgi:hypothetical protein
MNRRTKVMPLGPIAFNPSAINAPQRSPGMATSSQSADTTNPPQEDLCLSSFIRNTAASASRECS